MNPAELIFTGDLILDEPDPDHWLSGIAARTRAADFTLGHLEVPHTRSGAELVGDVPAPGADPGHLAALQRAGFDAVTLAGNHIADCGAQGIADTRATLGELGLASCGAGLDEHEAFAPLSTSCGGRRISVLSYNCVGPEASWARPDQAGCAYIRLQTQDGGPVRPAATLTAVGAEALQHLQAQVAEARAQCDLLIVALHKGVLHTPARLAPYERPLAHAVVEAGADIVVGHHAHIIRGIEFHRGKPIFHGLGNGCVVTRALSPRQDHPARADWAERRKQVFGFEPDPAFHLAPFHPEARNAMLGRVRWLGDGTLQAGFVPVQVEPPGRPVVAEGAEARAIARYVEDITVAAGLAPLVLNEADGWTLAA